MNIKLNREVEKYITNNSMTIISFAKSLNISKNGFYSYLNNTHTPNVKTAIKIAKKLKVDVNYLWD